MSLNLIDKYKSIKPELKGRDLTDYLIKQCLLKEYGMECPIIRTDKGKPIVKDAGLHISVSHSGDAFACVTADFNIGLDIQHEREIDVQKVADRYFTEGEAELVRKDGKEFFRLWARKEAYSKFTGEGLAEIMRKPDVLHPSDTVFRDMTICNGGRECFIALCAEKGADLEGIQVVFAGSDTA